MATFCVLFSYMTATLTDTLTYGTILPMLKTCATQTWITSSKCHYGINTICFCNNVTLCNVYVWHRMCIKGNIDRRSDIHHGSWSHPTTGLWGTDQDWLLHNDLCSTLSDGIDVWSPAVATPWCLRSGIFSKFNGGGSLGFTWIRKVLNVDL